MRELTELVPILKSQIAEYEQRVRLAARRLEAWKRRASARHARGENMILACKQTLALQREGLREARVALDSVEHEIDRIVAIKVDRELTARDRREERLEAALPIPE